MINKYSPKIPFTLDENNDLICNTDTINNLKQNIKMIILTNPGEKIMDDDFGLGIKKYLFELQNGMAEVDEINGERKIITRNLEETILQELKRQCRLYIDFLDVTNATFNYYENQLELYVEFVYNSTYSDSLTVTVKNVG